MRRDSKTGKKMRKYENITKHGVQFQIFTFDSSFVTTQKEAPKMAERS